VKLSDEDIADFEVLRDVAMANIFFGFYIWGAHWRHLANTTEPPLCSGNAALCQITLTTCFSLQIVKIPGVKLAPFNGHYTRQPALAGMPVKNWRVLLEQSSSITGWMPLLTAASTFGLGRRC